MRVLSSCRTVVAAACLALALPAGLARGQSDYQVLHSFDASNGGAGTPQGKLIQTADGSFYGTTLSGGGAGMQGTVFVMRPDGTGGFTFSTLHSFAGGGSDGARPQTGLILSTYGLFYGTTLLGGENNAGTVFVMDQSGFLAVVHFFGIAAGDGVSPRGDLVQASDGNIYGTTQGGGASGAGTVFKIDVWGNVTTIASFPGGSGGANPLAGLIQARDGYFYGTTSAGGEYGKGTVFRMAPSGALTVLHSFTGSDGARPQGELLQTSNGSFYGTTSEGPNGWGTLFEMDSYGVVITRRVFTSSDGTYPFGALIEGTDGDLYGTNSDSGANNLGTAFQFDPTSREFRTLHSFANGDGGFPHAGLIQASDGDFYGTASWGGPASTPGGVVFRLSLCSRLTAVAGGSASICRGASTPLTGSGGASCSWAPVAGLSDSNSCSPVASPSATTTYRLTVTDAYGCGSTNDATVTVTVNALPAATITPSGPTVFCDGGAVTLTASAGSSYLWSNGATTRAILVGSSGSFSVRVTDGNGCSSTSAATAVTVNPRPVAVASGTATILAGASTPLTGSGGVACSWAPATGLSSVTSCSPAASPSATTTYTLTVTDANGCVSVNSPAVTVTVLTPTTTTLNAYPNPSDVGESVILSAHVSSSSGFPGGTILFKDGATTLQFVTLNFGSATFSTSALSAGVHAITASYSGDATHAASVSPVVSQTVRRLEPGFSLISSSPSVFGNDVTLTVFVYSAVPSGRIPSGTVTLRDGVGVLWQLYGNGSLDGSGSAVLTMPGPAVGSHPITIHYSGDANFESATSRVFTHKVTSFYACGVFQGPLASSPAAPGNPQGVAARDLNGDDGPDVVTANFDTNTVSLFFGNRDGSFQPRFDYPVGVHPVAVALADLNDDGPGDIAVANAGSGTVSVLLRGPTGEYGPAQDYAAGTSPQSVAVGDFNGDGRLDLVVSNQGSANVSVFLGNGDGTFQAAIHSPAGTQPSGVVIGDFNNDAMPDIAVGNFDVARVSVLLGNGNGTFQSPVAYAVGPNPVSVAAADFNGNGILDLAVANSGASSVSVLLGNGDGTFKNAVNFATGSRPVSVAVGDFNGDGAPDLVTANSNSNNASVLIGNGNGTFQANTLYPVGTRPRAIAVADLDRNGKPDIVVANEVTDNFSVLTGGCPTTTAITHMGNPIPFGQQASFNIHVSSSSGVPLPTGRVTIKDGSAALGTAELSEGWGFFSTSPLCAGTHGITAVYEGDSEFRPSTSPVLNESVQAPAITAPASVCPGSSGNSASVGTAAPGSTYTWSITNGTIAGGNGTENILWASGTANPVTIKVVIRTTSGCVATVSKTVTNSAPSAVISAPVSVCAGSAGNTATVPGAGTGATYAWTIENGAITSGAATSAIRFTAGQSGQVVLHATVTNAAGCSVSGTKSVGVKPLPDSGVTAPAEVCPNSTGNGASVADAGPGAQYAWSVTNGTITAGAGTKAVVFTAKAAGSVTLKVTVTTNGCSSTTTRTVPIKTSC